MKVSIEFVDLTLEVANQLVEAAKSIHSGDKAEASTPAPKKAGRPKKVEAEEVEETDDDFGIGEEQDEAADVSLDDVRAAFQSFVRKHNDVKKGRMAAKKILSKFKVESLDDLEDSDYAKILEVIKAAK